jgi:hypothetical protein
MGETLIAVSSAQIHISQKSARNAATAGDEERRRRRPVEIASWIYAQRVKRP